MTDPLRIIAAHCFPPRESVEPHEDLAELGIDQCEAGNIALDLDDKCGVYVTDAELLTWRTVGDVLASVGRKA